MISLKNSIIKRALAVSLFLIIIILAINLSIPIPCFIHELTGLYCPGCGITRMFLAIFELNFYQAFRYNPLCFILIPILLPYVVYLVYIWIFGYQDKLSKYIDKVMIVITILLIIFGILRNLNAYSYLRPTIV